MAIYQASSKINIVTSPISTLAFALGNKEKLHRRIILKSARYLLGQHTAIKPWESALNEIKSNAFIPKNKNTFGVPVGNNLNTSFGKWIYCMVRVLKPNVMIETGVAHGNSTWIILNAMNKNGKGKLISIDLPNKDTNAAYNFDNHTPPTGWLIPEELKHHWELHLGDAKKLLPQLLEQTKNLDIFFHDSDHSFEHMEWEFATIFPYLVKPGVVLSDDVHHHAAFRNFVKTHNLRALQFNKGGCAVKV